MDKAARKQLQDKLIGDKMRTVVEMENNRLHHELNSDGSDLVPRRKAITYQRSQPQPQQPQQADESWNRWFTESFNAQILPVIEAIGEEEASMVKAQLDLLRTQLEAQHNEAWTRLHNQLDAHKTDLQRHRRELQAYIDEHGQNVMRNTRTLIEKGVAQAASAATGLANLPKGSQVFTFVKSPPPTLEIDDSEDAT